MCSSRGYSPVSVAFSGLYLLNSSKKSLLILISYRRRRSVVKSARTRGSSSDTTSHEASFKLLPDVELLLYKVSYCTEKAPRKEPFSVCKLKPKFIRRLLSSLIQRIHLPLTSLGTPRYQASDWCQRTSSR